MKPNKIEKNSTLKKFSFLLNLLAKPITTKLKMIEFGIKNLQDKIKINVYAAYIVCNLK